MGKSWNFTTNSFKNSNKPHRDFGWYREQLENSFKDVPIEKSIEVPIFLGRVVLVIKIKLWLDWTSRMCFSSIKVDWNQNDTLPKCRNFPCPSSCFYSYKYSINSSYIAFPYKIHQFDGNKYCINNACYYHSI